MINELDTVFKKPELRKELLFIINVSFDNIIADDIDILFRFLFNRKIFVKHFNFGNEFKTHFDLYIKEYLNYLFQFIEGTDEENIKRITSYFLDKEYYKEIYTNIALIYYYGVSGIMEKDYNKCLKKLNYLLKKNAFLYDDERLSMQYIYYINRNVRKKSKYSGIKLEEPLNDKELIELEKNDQTLF